MMVWDEKVKKSVTKNSNLTLKYIAAACGLTILLGIGILAVIAVKASMAGATAGFIAGAVVMGSNPISLITFIAAGALALAVGIGFICKLASRGSTPKVLCSTSRLPLQPDSLSSCTNTSYSSRRIHRHHDDDPFSLHHSHPTPSNTHHHGKFFQSDSKHYSHPSIISRGTHQHAHYSETSRGDHHHSHNDGISVHHHSHPR